MSSAPTIPKTNLGCGVDTSVSIQVTMSPVITCRLFQSASPFPRYVPVSGRISSWMKTGTPSSAASSRVRSSERESMTTISSTSGTRSIKRDRIARMTLRIVASSLRVGSPTEMRTFWRSFASTSRRRSANSLEVKVFSTNHLSTSSPRTRLRSARSSGSRERSTNTLDAIGARVRTITALRAASRI